MNYAVVNSLNLTIENLRQNVKLFIFFCYECHKTFTFYDAVKVIKHFTLTTY